MFTEVTRDPSWLISTQLDSDVYVGTGVFFVVMHKWPTTPKLWMVSGLFTVLNIYLFVLRATSMIHLSSLISSLNVAICPQ